MKTWHLILTSNNQEQSKMHVNSRKIFKAESYGQLSAKYQSKAITTELENEQAIALAQDLVHRANLTLEEEDQETL